MRGLTSDPCPALDALVAEYGPTFEVGSGPLRIVVVGDPGHLTPLLATSPDAFKWGHRLNVLGFIVGPGSMIVSDGDDHRRVRGAAQPGFARRRLDAWIPLIVRETDRLIGETLLGATTSEDFYEHGRTLAWRIVVRVLFGDDLGDRADELGAILEPAMTYGVQPALRQIPHPLPHTPRARARQALRDADGIIYEEIERRRRHPRSPDDARDVLDTLLAAEGDTLSMRDIRDQTVTLIAAGYDTTASGISWAVLRAALDPQIWARLRVEANAVFADRQADDLNGALLRNLTYSHAVVSETLRLNPPGVFSPRQAQRELVLGDVAIAKGTMVLWSSYVAGRLPEVWDDPLEFRPDRFIDPDPRQRAAIDAAWLPYGKGPRRVHRLRARTDGAHTRPRAPCATNRHRSRASATTETGRHDREPSQWRRARSLLGGPVAPVRPRLSGSGGNEDARPADTSPGRRTSVQPRRRLVVRTRGDVDPPQQRFARRLEVFSETK